MIPATPKAKTANLIMDRSSLQKKERSRSFFFQPKLTVGPVDDIYEREADAVADKVMRAGNERVQSKPAISSIQRACAECEKEEEVHRKPSGQTQPEAPAIVGDVVNSGGGRRMDDNTRSFMESRLGYDFSNVKIHNDTVAAKSAQSINALAYTSGNNVVFNAGQYSPETNTGKKLLAHELTHVVQQTKAPGNIQRTVEVKSGVELDTMGYSVTKAGNLYFNDRISKSSVWNEIVTGLFFSDRVFKVQGSTNAEANKNFKSHIVARIGVIEFAAKKKYDFAAGSAFTMNPDFWIVDHGKGSFEFKPGVDKQKAMDDLNVNPDKYKIACEAATAITMVGGGKSPFAIESSIAEDDWIPGDWGYIRNDNFPRPGGTPGLEGENIIYVGLDQYWGHFGKDKKYKTLKEWFDQVNGWHGAASITGMRRYPLKGLDR